MEDALALFYYGNKRLFCLILILVVMEDALALFQLSLFDFSCIYLNPCCNGRCTRTNEHLAVAASLDKS